MSNAKNILRKLVNGWIWFGEKTTGLTYPKASNILGLSGVLKKTVLDLPVLMMFITVEAVRFFLSDLGTHDVSSFILFAFICIATFLQWFVGEALWAFFVWNPRARKLNRERFE